MARTTLLTAIASAALLVACAAPPPPPAFTPPDWRMTEITDPALRGLDLFAAVGWDGGLMFVETSGYPLAHFSADGRRWEPRLLPGGAPESLSAPPFAGYRDFAYAVDADADGLVVWRTRDGREWEDRRLPASDLPEDRHIVTVAAGPRGVLVVRANRSPFTGEFTDNVGFEAWHSPDGETYRRTGHMPVLTPATDLSPGVVATEDGFLIHDTAVNSDGIYREDTPLYHSADGSKWTHVGDGLPQGARHAVGRDGDVLFVLGQTADGKLSAHYRRDADKRWRPGSIDLGKLPDEAVRPADQLRITFAHPWRDGHLAVGTTMTPGWAGIVWTSPDGVTWTRMPVRRHEFGRDVRLVAAGSSRGKTVLFGMSGISSARTAAVRLWEAEHGP